MVRLMRLKPELCTRTKKDLSLSTFWFFCRPSVDKGVAPAAAGFLTTKVHPFFIERPSQAAKIGQRFKNCHENAFWFLGNDELDI